MTQPQEFDFHASIARLAVRFAALRVECDSSSIRDDMGRMRHFHNGVGWADGCPGWSSEPNVKVACWEIIAHFWNLRDGDAWREWLGSVEEIQQEATTPWQDCSFEEAVLRATEASVTEHPEHDHAKR